MIKRDFAPAEQRLRHLIAREKAMPAALAEARRNLDAPPRIYTEITIEQIDGNRAFFETRRASAFPAVKDAALLAEFKRANDAAGDHAGRARCAGAVHDREAHRHDPEGGAGTVEETPPFLRATTTASMDIPGPFETVATEAFYNMTLPDPNLTRAQTEEFMTQWYYLAITNVSVHEVWPGHYLQFLYAKDYPSDVRRVFGAATNAEGWAHYAEQMVIDEGWLRLVRRAMLGDEGALFP